MNFIIFSVIFAAFSFALALYATLDQYEKRIKALEQEQKQPLPDKERLEQEKRRLENIAGAEDNDNVPKSSI